MDPLVLPDEMWLKGHGTKEIIYRKALEEDVSALDRYTPDFVLGTTPFCAIAKDRGIPAMYFTNQVASRPFFLSTGLDAILTFINSALQRGEKYREMHAFFAE
jgi:chlorophyllide a reductase subunit Y